MNTASYDWAVEEVRLACLKEQENNMMSSYVEECYKSALKAYKLLLDDGHSGHSFPYTVNILQKMCKGFPLTPIEDVPEVWTEIEFHANEIMTVYQCKRDFSLFKNVYADGTVKYNDNDRIKCVDPFTGETFNFGFVSNLINEKFPITMPYLPEGTYMVSVISFLAEEKEGYDFDTIGVSSVLTPDKETVPIHRFFREPNDDEEPTFNGWIEIDRDEFMKRYAGRVK